jgi:hypothetical protein
MSDFGGTPLAVGTVTGHRAWNVDHLGRLRGITHPAVWLPGENVAACKGHRGSSMYFGWGVETPEKREPCTDEQIPVDSCGCGFWAYHAGGDRPKPSDERPSIPSMTSAPTLTRTPTSGRASRRRQRTPTRRSCARSRSRWD